MMPRRKSRMKVRINKTAHRRALATPIVRRLVLALRRNWKKIDPIERGVKLRKLASLGCSTRGLAEQFGISATSIRRHMTLAALPELAREAVRNGHSAKKILTNKEQADRLIKMRERVAEDASSGELSDRLATSILEFCLTPKGTEKKLVLEPNLDHLLNLVGAELTGLEADGVMAIKLPKHLTFEQRLAKTCPRPEFEEFWLAQQCRWLANFLYSVAPEKEIRESAIKKARGRSKELRTKTTDTPGQAFLREAIRTAKISAGTRRPYHLGGAHRLKRQGS